MKDFGIQDLAPVNWTASRLLLRDPWIISFVIFVEITLEVCLLSLDFLFFKCYNTIVFLLFFFLPGVVLQMPATPLHTHIYAYTWVCKKNAQARDKNEPVLTTNHNISKARYTDVLNCPDRRDSSRMMRWHIGSFWDSNNPMMFKASQFRRLVIFPPLQLTLPILSIFSFSFFRVKF